MKIEFSFLTYLIMFMYVFLKRTNFTPQPVLMVFSMLAAYALIIFTILFVWKIFISEDTWSLNRIGSNFLAMMIVSFGLSEDLLSEGWLSVTIYIMFVEIFRKVLIKSAIKIARVNEFLEQQARTMDCENK